MMEVELKLQPEGNPKQYDGLLFGGNDPVLFLGVAANLDGHEKVLSANAGLIGQDGYTYLFKPVCYDHPSCFVPERFNEAAHNVAFKVKEYPASIPVSITRLERLGSPAELEKARALQKKRRIIRNPNGFGVPPEMVSPEYVLPLIVKAEWLNGIPKPTSIQWMEKPRVDDDKLLALAEENDRMRLEMYMAGALPKERKGDAEGLVDSIQYAINYANGERLLISGFERVAWRMADMEKVELARKMESGDKDVVEFSNGFKRIRIISASGNIVLHDVKLGQARHTDEALRHLFEHLKRDWLTWSIVVKASGSPPSWTDEKKPLWYLSGGHPGKKKNCLECIIEDRGNSNKREIRLKPNFHYIEK